MSIQQLFFGGEISPYLMTATGGTITYDGKFAVHTFSASGTFTVTYKSTSGLTYNALLIGHGNSGSDGYASDGTQSKGEDGGGGGSGGPFKPYTALPVDTGFSSAAVTIGANETVNTTFNWGGAYNYSSIDAGFVQASGGNGGAGETGTTAATAGGVNSPGTSSSITGSAINYAGGGAGGGGGGSSARTGTGAAGGTGINGGGNGGAGGSASSGGNGFAGSIATSGYGTGGGAGGGAYSDESNFYAGGTGASGRPGVVIVRYQYLP